MLVGSKVGWGDVVPAERGEEEVEEEEGEEAGRNRTASLPCGRKWLRGE